MDTFDASDFLREFNNLQPVDIVAQAMELTLIPADFNNNNKDLLSQAMEIAEISWKKWLWIMYGLWMRKFNENEIVWIMK